MSRNAGSYDQYTLNLRNDHTPLKVVIAFHIPSSISELLFYILVNTWYCQPFKCSPSCSEYVVISHYSFFFLTIYYLFFYFLVNYFTILYWFCHTPTCIPHRYTRVPHPEPPPSSLPVPSLWVVSVHQPRASSILH